MTGDARYRTNSVDLIRYHVGRPDLYLGGSTAARAISESYEEPTTTPDVAPPALTAVSAEAGA